MKIFKFFALALLLLSPLAAAESPSDASDRFMKRARQITFEGRRAGEGYFSADGARLIFQSEREAGNPFYQIYELDLESGETRRLSNGVGKTTCAFARPGSREVLFASTHHDPRSGQLQKEELEMRASGKERRYAWDYDPEMELYVRNEEGTLRRMTSVRGYDAEASYSPDGKWIVYSSTRQAYDGSVEVDVEQMELDPSVYAELYLMPADGGESKRLTFGLGYDGGPFFTADSERVIWRRFDPQGLIADLWTIKLDGSDERQITDFASMSWAPYPHPSGDYFVFTSNKHGFENFEIFVVDVAGKKEPQRVTFTDGFDGLPVFAPDGKRLAWTTNRGGGDGAQLWWAQWDHEAAKAALAAAPARGN